MTYIYSDSTAVVGPLALQPEPHTYDLCEPHARSLTAPRGWQLVRHDGELVPPPDDLDAIAKAVREADQPWRPSLAGEAEPAEPTSRRGHAPAEPTGRHNHLRVIPPA